MKKIIWLAAAAILVAAGITAALLYCDHQWIDATCSDPSVCTKCEKTKGEALGHDWRGATCTDPEICSRCGETQGNPTGHTWQAAACTAPETCSVCGETQGTALGHTWQDATCAAPKTCTVCAQTEGSALEHSWTEATCLIPRTCSLCGQTQGDPAGHQWESVTCTEPATCSVCGETSGSALGHSWKAATCTSAKTCTICGATSGNPLGHKLAESTDGVTRRCYTCGESVKIKYVAITFDDGPSGNTEKLLAGLDERGVKATFFICGYQINRHKTLPQTILDHGHEIGLHTYNHATLTKLDADGIREELEGMLPLLPEGYKVTLMRPPGGACNAKVKEVCADLGLSIIMWSVDPKDWATKDVDTIVSRIVTGASDGSIILMHDLKSSSVTAALQAIDQLQAQGYVFVTVPELAEIRDKQLEAGVVYYAMK